MEENAQNTTNPNTEASADQAAATAAQQSAQAPEAAPAAPSVDEQLAAARKESAHNHDRFMRAVADLENYRRRAMREKEELRLFASKGLLEDMLPVLDNLQFGLTAARQNEAAKSVADGVSMVLEQLKATLAKHGLKEINPVGEKFDPNLHESISHQPSAEVPEEHVLHVVRIGYALNGRLLRAASVVLSSGPAK